MTAENRPIEKTEAELDLDVAERRIKAREKWLSGLDLKDKNRVLFELEILLKGLDRFFNISNLPIANMERVVSINFIDEMEIVYQFVERTVELSGVLLEAGRRKDYQFRYYVETKLLGDYERTRRGMEVLEQRTPEDSLFVLYSTFVNLREVIRGINQLRTIPYTLFFNVGNLISREIVSNHYFSPARYKHFRPEYDKVVNRLIGRIIHSIDDSPFQKQVSIIILAFNRLIQYVRFISPESSSMDELKNSLLFFALIHSESRYLMEFMENNLPGRLKKSSHPLAGAFAETCDSVSFQLRMELKKIHSGELLNLAKRQEVDAVKTGVENSHGILLNFYQQSIIQLLKVFRPEILGEEIFPLFLSQRRQSIKVREDLAVFQSLMDKFEEITETTEAGVRHGTYIKYLLLQKGWISKMRVETCPLMRYQDLIEFEKYFDLIESLTIDDLHIMDTLDKFKMESKFFKILLETTLSHINNRSELGDAPLDQARVSKLLKRFIADFLR